jgi:hypothetical protein
MTNLAAAFAEAARRLAVAQGASGAPGATNLLLHTGETALGVFGTPQTELQPLAGGGYRRRTWLPLTIPKGALAAAPEAKKRIVRTDTTPPVSYLIDRVEPDRATDWLLVLMRYGED